jgi:NTP pyrophosphatase (non-canonical NTP hydrolase)
MKETATPCLKCERPTRFDDGLCQGCGPAKPDPPTDTTKPASPLRRQDFYRRADAADGDGMLAARRDKPKPANAPTHILMHEDGRPPRADTLYAIVQEVQRARMKHRSNAHMMVALTEEVGELAQALLENGNGERAREEAIQVACVAIRIIEEGDADFEYKEV